VTQGESTAISAEHTVVNGRIEYAIRGIAKALEEPVGDCRYHYSITIERIERGPLGEYLSQGNIVGEDGEPIEKPLTQSELDLLVVEMADSYT
jgi:hypothetical protein